MKLHKTWLALLLLLSLGGCTQLNDDSSSNVSPTEVSELERAYEIPAHSMRISTARAERSKAGNVHVSHEYAARLIRDALREILNREPLRHEVQLLQAQARLESNYGMSWKGAGLGSNNWGSVHAPGCPEDSFVSYDHMPNGRRYKVCFRSYESEMAGVRDFVRIALRTTNARNALKYGSATWYCTALYNAKYYGGYGETKEERIGYYRRRLVGLVHINAKTMGETVAIKW